MFVCVSWCPSPLLLRRLCISVSSASLTCRYSASSTLFMLNVKGNYADAISCYNEVLRIDPLAADGLVNRGSTYKEIGRVNEAIQNYSRAIVIRPNMAEAHANLASAYKDSGHVEAAIKSYRQALAILSDFPEATCNLLHTLQVTNTIQKRLNVSSTQLPYQSAPFQAAIMFVTCINTSLSKLFFITNILLLFWYSSITLLCICTNYAIVKM